mmetsp:Transcript_658/g.1358  ORF Transcript_658/g.1358 Transcript_658/m.1358 type:complete len:239 (+) Transcript_658:278-994(+)
MLHPRCQTTHTHGICCTASHHSAWHCAAPRSQLSSGHQASRSIGPSAYSSLSTYTRASAGTYSTSSRSKTSFGNALAKAWAAPLSSCPLRWAWRRVWSARCCTPRSRHWTSSLARFGLHSCGSTSTSGSFTRRSTHCTWRRASHHRSQRGAYWSPATILSRASVKSTSCRFCGTSRRGAFHGLIPSARSFPSRQSHSLGSSSSSPTRSCGSRRADAVSWAAGGRKACSTGCRRMPHDL